MEKRTLLAFALSLLVLLVWQWMFAPPPKKVVPKAVEKQEAKNQATRKSQAKRPEKEETGKETQKPSTPIVPSTSATLPPPVKKPGGRLVVVETPNYRAVFSTKGAVLRSFRLKKYTETIDKNSPPKELIRIKEKDWGYYPFLTELIKHSDVGLAYADYVPDKTKLQVQDHSGKKQLVFTWTSPRGIVVTKTFTFYPENYLFDMEITLENTKGDNLSDSLSINLFNTPYEKHKSRLNPNKVSVLKKKGLEDFKEKKVIKVSPTIPGPFKWIGYENNYFITALIPKGEKGYNASVSMVNQESHLVRTVFITSPFQLSKGNKTTFDVRFFIGPKDLGILKAADYSLAKSVNFGWFDIIAKPLLWFMNYTFKYVHNYGIAIIIVTVVIKILFWPLTHKSYQSMKMMKKLQPKMTAIREKYKNDREKLNKELMNLYRTYKVNPVGGCLPMVLQIPVFFALYRMLYGAIELRHAPFWLWINDLSAPDRLNIGFNIPYLGGLPVLTILMGVSMFIQQKMTPTGGDPRQEKMMLLMPVVFTVFFVNFPSGLVLYWLVNNILSIGQQYFINKQA